MNKALLLLLTMSLGGSLAALGLMALRRLLAGRVRRSVLYYLWLVVLLRFCLPLPGLISWQSWESEPAAVAGASAGSTGNNYVNYSSIPTPSQPEQELREQPATSMENAAPRQENAPVTVNGSAAAVSPVRRAAFPLTREHILLLLYVAGALGSALWFALGYRRFAREIRRRSLPPTERERHLLQTLCGKRTVGLLRCPGLPTPLLLGVFHPEIVLPAEPMCEEELRFVFDHELVHARRLDLAYKWLSLLVLSAHWFNPIVYIIRPLINRDCELSCDEAVIAPLAAQEKQNYGELLIRIAAAHPLPAALPATTLCEDRAHLKERLVNIMQYRRLGKTAAGLALAATVLLCGCAVSVGSGAAGGSGGAVETESPFASDGNLWASSGNLASDGNVSVYTGYAMQPYATSGNVLLKKTVTVSTVDELLAAIAPNTEVILSPGVYDLSRATPAFYNYCYWKPTGNGSGSELMICWAFNLCLRGESGQSEDVRIVCDSSNILTFEDCWTMQLRDLSVGHSATQGGAALQLSGSTGILYMENCDLFNCDYGVLSAGVWSVTGQSVTIRDCAAAAVYLGSSETFGGGSVRFVSSTFRDCGSQAGALLSFSNGDRAEFTDCVFEGNRCPTLMDSSGYPQLTFTGCTAADNGFTQYFTGRSSRLTTRDCSFPGYTL